MTQTKAVLSFLTVMCAVLLIFKYIEYQDIFVKERKNIPENNYTDLFYQLKKQEMLSDVTALILVEAIGAAAAFMPESIPYLVLFYFFILYFLMNAKRRNAASRWRCPYCGSRLADGVNAGNIQLYRRCRGCGKRLY